MKCFFLCLLFVLPSVVCFAQEEDYQNWGQAYGFDPKDVRYVYVDTANIRTAPRSDAPLQDKLWQGCEVTILNTGKLFTMAGKSAPWCEVSYMKTGATQKGWLWSGVLSPRILRKDDVLFLYGMRFSAANDTPTRVHVKAIRHDSVIAHTSFEINSSQTARGSHDASVSGPKRLAGLSCLLYFTYSGEACAVPTIEQYIAWDGSSLIVLPQIYSEVDAGVYAIEQKYTFPADRGGKPAELRMREVIEQYDEGDKPVSRKIKTTRYRWDSATKKLRKI